MRGRAYRRHQRRRFLARTMRFLRINGWPSDRIKEGALQLYQHRAVCSCWMCSNQYEKLIPRDERQPQLYGDSE